MRDLTPGEMLSLREFLTAETTGLVNAKTIQPLIQDDQLRASCESSIQAMETRIKALQQFVQENGIMSIEGGVQ